MGWWAAATLTLNCQKSQNKGGWDLSWRWWLWTMLSTNLLDVMLLHWSKNLKTIPTWKAADVDDKEAEEAENSSTSGVPNPMPPFSPSLSRTGGDTATSRLLATQTSLIQTLQVRPLSQGCPTRPCHRPWHRYCELEPSPWSGLATPLRRKRLRQTHRVSLCQEPINTALQASLTRRNHIPETVKKGELRSPNLKMQPGNWIKQIC